MSYADRKADTHVAIHVDYNPAHACLKFDDMNDEPILFYRDPTDRQLANLERLRAGKRWRGELPDGWVLAYNTLHDGGCDEYVTGITGLGAVDEAVRAAQHHLASYIERHQDPGRGMSAVRPSAPLRAPQPGRNRGCSERFAGRRKPS